MVEEQLKAETSSAYHPLIAKQSGVSKRVSRNGGFDVVRVIVARPRRRFQCYSKSATKEPVRAGARIAHNNAVADKHIYGLPTNQCIGPKM